VPNFAHITPMHRALGRQLLLGPISADSTPEDRANALSAALQSDSRLSVLSTDRTAVIAFKNLLSRSGLSGEIAIDHTVARALMRFAASCNERVRLNVNSGDPATLAIAALIKPYASDFSDPVESMIVFRDIALAVPPNDVIDAFAPAPGLTNFVAALEAITAEQIKLLGDTRYAKMINVITANISTDENRVFNSWTPRIVQFEGQKPHPYPLVEANTLASIRPEALARAPLISRTAVLNGAVSDAQAEAIAIVVNAHEKLISITEGEEIVVARRGALLADGTGTGKSTTAIGVVFDASERGFHRHVIVLEKRKHIEAFKKALRSIGSAIPIQSYQDVLVKNTIELAQGIVAVTYATLRQTDEARYPAVEALARWMQAQADGNGVIFFDESQNMRNAENDDGAISLQATAAMKLEGALLLSRVVYASATGATQIQNLGYMRRLGLWGPSNIHPTFNEFAAHMRASASLEALAIHLKSQGLMASRTLSLSGVTYTTLDHTYTVAQRANYQLITQLIADTIAIGKQFFSIYRNNKTSLSLAQLGMPTLGYSADATVSALLSSIARSIVETVETSFLMPTVIERAERAIREGMAPVIQLSSTGEAEFNRQLDGGKDVSEIKVGSSIVNILEHILLPASKLQPTLTRNLNHLTHHLVHLLERWKRVPSVELPLDQIMDAFGPEAFGEMSGRSKRRLKDGTSYRVAPRNQQDALADHAAFMNGMRQGIVFTTQYGGTGYDYDANAKVLNKAQRLHIIVETSNQVDQVVQGIGRTHRSGQVIEPIVMLARSDLPGESIRNASIQRNITRLGALSMGHRDGASRALFDHIEDITSMRANYALIKLINDISRNKYPTMSMDAIKVYDLTSGSKFFGEQSVTKTFRRLRLAPLSFQQDFFDAYLDTYKQTPKQTIDSYDDGAPLPLAGTPAVTQRDRFYSDSETGQWIDVVTLSASATGKFLSFDTAMNQAELVCLDNHRPVLKHRRFDGAIMIQARISENESLDPTGRHFKVFTPQGSTMMSALRRQIEGGAVLNDIEYARKIWDERTTHLKRVEETDRLMIVGSLLTIEALMRNKKRSLSIVKTEANESLVGYIVNDKIVNEIREELPHLARNLNAETTANAQRLMEAGEPLITIQGHEISLQAIPDTYISTAAPGVTPDPRDHYILVTVDVTSLTTTLLRRMRSLGLIATDMAVPRKAFIGCHNKSQPVIDWALRIAGLSAASASSVGENRYADA